MTNDLVEELRNLVGPEVNQEVTPFITVEYITIKKAADRIEELETALRYYAKGYENPFGGDDSLIARKALEGKND